jgi:hypothetical protein
VLFVNDKILLLSGRRVTRFQGGPSNRIDATRTGPILVDLAPFRTDKRAFPALLILHLENDHGKPGVPVKNHFRVSVKELLGRNAEPFFQAQDIIGHQHETQSGAAPGEALHVPVTEESESVPVQGYKHLFF